MVKLSCSTTIDLICILLIYRTNLLKKLFFKITSEEAKSVWQNETSDLKDRVKVCITLMSKIYQLYASIYTEKIESLSKQIDKLNLELENRIQTYDDTLDEMKHNPTKQLLLSLIDRSLITFTRSKSIN